MQIYEMYAGEDRTLSTVYLNKGFDMSSIFYNVMLNLYLGVKASSYSVGQKYADDTGNTWDMLDEIPNTWQLLFTM